MGDLSRLEEIGVQIGHGVHQAVEEAFRADSLSDQMLRLSVVVLVASRADESNGSDERAIGVPQ